MKFSTDISLTNVVAELLQTNPLVCIPGLGAFISTEIPAVLNEPENEFFPPSKKISFNARITNNDGLLASKISLRGGMSYNQANALISKEVSVFQSQNQAKLEFPELGSLTKELDGTLHFYPLNLNSLNINAYGLERVYAQPIRITDPVLITLRNHSNKESRRIIPVRKLAYSIAAAAVITLILITSFQFSLVQNSGNAVLGWIAPVNQSYKGIPTELLHLETIEISSYIPAKVKKFSLYYFEPVSEVQDGVMLIGEFTNSLVINKTSTSQLPANFRIVVGAFSSKQRAENFAKKVRNEGFLVDISATPTTGFNTVSVGAFATENEAFDYLPKVSTKFPEAWVKVN